MKPDPSKLRHQTEETQTEALNQSQQKPAVLEFASVDELIRYDAEHTLAPPNVAERLDQSIAKEPKLAVPWWRRWFLGKR